ncbi:hypothetical protein [Synechococcus sp. CC9616]|jgi:hypothetical protein|uniref:hypothetical protein n=1 Tax=Synechococcus sp. CC9616 TaxID=110663 RepID=UPI001E405B7B|nr:hypothetical protein [Synechococcus sp. CC9616]|tara:strand:+ start:1857 stop:2075 length:219 start_codon:yes stop_codon:yes gene_type:complete
MNRPTPVMIRVLLAALLSMAAFIVVLATGAEGSESYTTHIGLRVPPSEAGCIKTGEIRTDEGKVLNIFRCPL